MSAGPMPDNSQSSEGRIWPVNDPPLVLSSEPKSYGSTTDDGALEPVNDPVVTLRQIAE